MRLRRRAMLQELSWFSVFVLIIWLSIMLGAETMSAIGIGLVVYAAWHFIQATRLLRPLLAGTELPERWVWGIWGEAFEQLRRLKRRENRRKRQHKSVFTRIRKMAEAMPDAVLTLGKDGEISWLNRQAKAYFGLGDTPVLGRRLLDLIDHPILRDYLRAGSFRRGLEVEAPGDPSIMLAVSVTRFKKRRERYLLVARDITPQYHLNRTQRDFTLNVSHELRTPLTVLRGYLETMADSEDPHSAKRLPLLRMREQVSRMQGVIQDLFTLSRLEYGSEKLQRKAVAVFEVLSGVVQEAGELARNTHHELELEGDPDLMLLGDESLLRCVFTNLVTNAIRHTPSRSRIEISWQREGEGTRLQVRDNGAGIPARHLPRLTERFYRVDASRSRERGGTGLGLAIVRQILDMHDARLSISSEEGRGATFSCLFPASMTLEAGGGSAATEAS